MDKSKMLIKWWNKTKNMLNHKLYKIKYHLGTWNNLRITNKINNKAKKTTIQFKHRKKKLLNRKFLKIDKTQIKL